MLYRPTSNALPFKHFEQKLFSESWAVQKIFLEPIYHAGLMPPELLFYSWDWPCQVSLESTCPCLCTTELTIFYLLLTIFHHCHEYGNGIGGLTLSLFITLFLTVLIPNFLNLDHHIIYNQPVNLNVVVWLLKIIEVISFHIWSSLNTHVSPQIKFVRAILSPFFVQ